MLKAVFALIALFCLTPWASPGFALALGLALGLTGLNPFIARTKTLSKPLLQVSVVLLGTGMDLGNLLRAGREGFLLAAVTIFTVLVLGRQLGRMLGIHPRASALISAGTAICGGSAIAAVGSAIAATQAEMTVALGTIFMLNGVALYLFPPLGMALGLTPQQFGAWSGIAIHDISSVVGAAASFPGNALEIATAVKLSRTLWILPLAAGFAWVWRHERPEDASPSAGKAPVPWFIVGFLLASLAGTFLTPVHAMAPWVVGCAQAGMRLTLFFIGAGVCRKTLKTVGWRPLVQGVILWVVISLLSLSSILFVQRT